MSVMLHSELYKPLRAELGERLQTGVNLARYTAARLGGAADLFFEAQSMQDLVQVASICWEYDIPMVLLGGGSNVLISDAGVRGLVMINKAKDVRFVMDGLVPTVRAESGANLGLIARQSAQRGFSGLEWAAGIPGTVGGAVVGNAGAFGEDMAGNLIVAEILHQTRENVGEICRLEEWTVDRLGYAYRSSNLKKQPGQDIVLAAVLRLQSGDPEKILARMDEWHNYRKRTQPPGASMGSMFKNPAGDYAGRLIEAAGLKGKRQGSVQISMVHANFFVNDGQAKAADVYRLIKQAQKAVLLQFGVSLELEIELMGDWEQVGLDG